LGRNAIEGLPYDGVGCPGLKLTKVGRLRGTYHYANDDPFSLKEGKKRKGLPKE